MDKHIKIILNALFSLILAAVLFYLYSSIKYSLGNSAQNFLDENSWISGLIIFIIGIILIFLFYFIIAPILVEYFSSRSGTNYSDDYKTIYTKLYHKYCNTLKNLQTKVVLREAAKTTLLFVFFVTYIMLQFSNLNIYFSLLFLALAIIMYISIFFLTKSATSEYINMYKNKIIGGIIESFNLNLDYSPTVNDQKYVINLYKSANLYSRYYNDFFADDYIKGFLGNGTPIQIFNIITNRAESAYNKTIIFNGLFAVADLTFDASSNILIARKIIPYEGASIQTDNQDFEKNFLLFSDDKILAMRIFTPEILDFISNFYNLHKLDFEFSMHDKKIYFKFNTGDMFEPNTLGNPMNRLALYTYYYTLEFIIELIEKISNTINDIDNYI